METGTALTVIAVCVVVQTVQGLVGLGVTLLMTAVSRRMAARAMRMADDAARDAREGDEWKSR